MVCGALPRPLWAERNVTPAAIYASPLIRLNEIPSQFRSFVFGNPGSEGHVPQYVNFCQSPFSYRMHYSLTRFNVAHVGLEPDRITSLSAWTYPLIRNLRPFPTWRLSFGSGCCRSSRCRRTWPPKSLYEGTRNALDGLVLV